MKKFMAIMLSAALLAASGSMATECLADSYGYSYSYDPHNLADFGYRELCFALDNLYGLKETHDISNFDQLFWQIAFDKDLSSTDPEVSDAALYKFIDYHLDDLHSTFDNYSYQTGAREVPWGTGPASVRFDEAAETHSFSRPRRGGHYEHGIAFYPHVDGRSQQDHFGTESAWRTL